MLKTNLSTKDLMAPLSEYDEQLVSKFIGTIYDDIVYNISSDTLTSDMSIINTPINRGIVFHTKKMTQSTEMWKALLRVSVQVLLGSDYRLDHAYITTSESGKKSSRYHVYIKPSLRLRAQIPVKQLFGNLFFDLTIDEGQAKQWKLLSNVHCGRNYQEPLELHDLINAMWGNI